MCQTKFGFKCSSTWYSGSNTQVYYNTQSFMNLALSCRKINLMLKENVIWKWISIINHEVNGVTLAKELRNFEDNWFSMFLRKPMIRRDGTYISKGESLNVSHLRETRNQR
jgi:hypothetical protein